MSAQMERREVLTAVVIVMVTAQIHQGVVTVAMKLCCSNNQT